MPGDGFYARLRRFTQAGDWSGALALMRSPMLPNMQRAFRTTRSDDGCFEMVFRFGSMAEMHEADREWHEFRAASAIEAGTVETEGLGAKHESAVPQGDAHD